MNTINTWQGQTQKGVSTVNQNKSHSRGMLSGSFHACRGKIEENALLNGCVEDAPHQPLSIHLFNKDKKPRITALYDKGAFTLIELLVVVLIIGILAAVAFPQYQFAVEKSRIMGIVPVLKAIKQAERVYYLEHGAYTEDITKLDIDLADSQTEVQPGLLKYDFEIEIRPGISAPRVIAYPEKANVGIWTAFDDNDQWRCYAINEKGKQTCVKLGCRAAAPVRQGCFLPW